MSVGIAIIEWQDHAAIRSSGIGTIDTANIEVLFPSDVVIPRFRMFGSN